MLRKSPWAAAVLCFFFWAINNVSLKFITTNDISFTLFTCQTMLFAAITLLAVSKPGPLGLQTLKALPTWGFGVCFIIEQIVLLALMQHVSATEAIFLGKINVLTSLLFAWAFKNRKPRAMTLLALVPLLLGLWLFAGNIPPQFMAYTLTMLLLYAVLLSAEILFIEVHDTSNKTQTFSDDARVTALVIGITSMGLLLLVGSLSFVEHFSGGDFGELTPTLAQALNYKSLFYAGFLGIFIASTTRYLEFVSVRQIKSEHFLALSALSPIFTYLLERLFQLPTLNLSSGNLIAAVAVLGGSFAILATRSKAEPRYNVKDRALIAQAKDQAQAALVHHAKSEPAAAKALGIPLTTFASILAGQKLYAPHIYKKVKQGFEQNVLSRDLLTGLQNRLSFLTRFNRHLSTATSATLCLIDLNKFKPINDTYGHAAGDTVLKQVASRLHQAYGKQAEVTRLGGDEFCLLFYKKQTDTTKLAKDLQRLIQAPITLQAPAKSVRVTASIGFAHFPQQGKTSELLLEAADKAMYKNKP